MRVGIQLPSFSYGGCPADSGATFGRLAREADQAGLDSLWVMDHSFQIGMHRSGAVTMLADVVAQVA